MFNIMWGGSRVGMLNTALQPIALNPCLTQVFTNWIKAGGIQKLSPMSGEADCQLKSKLLPLTLENITKQLKAYGFTVEEQR